MSTYRPQFAFKSPLKCDEQRCIYSFDFTNTPWLATTIAAGDIISRIPLELDKDADFYLRAISTLSVTGAGLEIRLEDPKGHPLSDIDNLVETQNFQYPELYSEMFGAGIVALDNADDYGVFCQQGSRLFLHLYNNGPAPIILGANGNPPLVVNLYGVKRYSGDRCAA